MPYPTHGPEFHERLAWTSPCRAATTANITISTALNNADVLDGVTLATGDRVLVKDQSTGSQNGIYVVSASPARATDFSDPNVVGSVVVVSEGTVNADTIWQCTTNAPITLGTTALVFAALSSSDDLTVVSPSQLTANTDNWNPTGLSTADAIRASTDASRNLTGIVAPATVRAIVLENVGAFDLVLKHDVTSTAANRFYCPNDADVTLQKDSSIFLVYDLTSTRWRVVGGAGGGTQLPRDLNYIIDGGVATLTTGIRQVVRIPWACTVTAWRMYADQDGSVQVDVLRTTHSSYDMPSTHPVLADSIIGAGTDMIITTTDKAESTSLNWDVVTLAAGDVLAFYVVSATTIRKVTIVLTLQP